MQPLEDKALTSIKKYLKIEELENNLPMKKLYKLKHLLLFLIILFAIDTKIFAMIKDATTECYTPANFNNPTIEETVFISPVQSGHTLGRCNWDTPAFLVSNPNDPRKGLCAKVQKCVHNGILYDSIKPAGQVMYIYADPGISPGYTAALTSTGSSMGSYDTAYPNLASCQAANPDRIIGLLPLPGSSTYVAHFRDIDSCKTAYTNATTSGGGLSSALSDGGCFFATPNSGKQTQILTVSVAGSPSHYCSCATTNRGRPPFYDVFVESPSGVKNTYFSGLSTDAGYDAAKNNCFNNNTNRFYSPSAGQCFSTLDSCKAATRTARDLACTEAQEVNIFLLFPPGTKTEITPSEEATKRSSILNCVRSGKTDIQCLNEYFGAGPTSTAIKNSDFYRCRCQANLTGALCTVGSLAGVPCAKICSLTPSGFVTAALAQNVTISSPLQFIKVLSNFLFYAAIFLFIVNFLLAGFDYVRSGGQPDALKTAQAKITNAIGGLVFILLVGALLNYIISILISSGFQA